MPNRRQQFGVSTRPAREGSPVESRRARCLSLSQSGSTESAPTIRCVRRCGLSDGVICALRSASGLRSPSRRSDTVVRIDAMALRARPPISASKARETARCRRPRCRVDCWCHRKFPGMISSATTERERYRQQRVARIRGTPLPVRNRRGRGRIAAPTSQTGPRRFTNRVLQSCSQDVRPATQTFPGLASLRIGATTSSKPVSPQCRQDEAVW